MSDERETPRPSLAEVLQAVAAALGTEAAAELLRQVEDDRA